MKRWRLVFLLATALLLPPLAVGAMPFTRLGSRMTVPPLPRCLCFRTGQEIKIDGSLTEPAWQKAEAVALTLYDASGPPRRPTEVRACWDDTNLYLSFVSHDDDIWATMTKRDSPLWNEKVVEAFIAPKGLTRYFELEANPLNTVVDLIVSSPRGTRRGMKTDLSWTCRGWTTATFVNGKVNDPAVRDEYWISEWAIPFSQISPDRKPPRPGTVWRINFYRIDLRRDGSAEYSAWSPTLTPRPDFHVPRRFGYLEFSSRVK